MDTTLDAQATFFDRLHHRMPDFLAWGFVGATLILSAWGRLADGVNVMSLFFAAIFVLFQLGTNMMAIWARTLGKETPATMVGCVAAMVIFGLFSHVSLTHAWAEAAERGYVDAASWLSTILLFFLPFSEPFMFWVRRLLWEIEAKALRERQLAADKAYAEQRQLDREHSLALADRAERGEPAPRRSRARMVAGATMAAEVLRAGFAAADTPPPMLDTITQLDAGQDQTYAGTLEMAPRTRLQPPRTGRAPRRGDKAYAIKCDKARELLLAGELSQRAIAAKCKIGLAKVNALNQEMTPLRQMAEAA